MIPQARKIITEITIGYLTMPFPVFKLLAEAQLLFSFHQFFPKSDQLFEVCVKHTFQFLFIFHRFH